MKAGIRCAGLKFVEYDLFEPLVLLMKSSSLNIGFFARQQEKSQLPNK